MRGYKLSIVQDPSPALASLSRRSGTLSRREREASVRHALRSECREPSHPTRYARRPLPASGRGNHRYRLIGQNFAGIMIEVFCPISSPDSLSFFR